MGDRNITMVASGVSAVVLFLGIWSNSWWTGALGPLEVGFGLREMSICTMGQCTETAYKSFGPRGAGNMFTMFGNMTFFVGLAAACMTVIGTYFYLFQGLDRFKRIAGYACISIIPLSGMTLMSFPGTHALSVGWSMPVTIFGCLIGAYAAFKAPGGSWDGGEYKPIVAGPAGGIGGRTPAPAVDESGLAPLPGGHAQATPAQEVSPAPSQVRPAAEMPLLDLEAAPAAAIGLAAGGNADFARPLFGGPAVVGAAPSLARKFFASRVELSSVGVSATLASGGQRDLMWSDIRRIAARRLPAGPPHNGAVFVDIVVLPLLGRPSPPIRLTTATDLEIDVDAGTTSERTGDVLRDFGVLAEHHKPGTVESASQPYFSTGAGPQELADDAAVVAHDEQFVGGADAR